ncbi:zinc finger and SCAN domain-containing protein 29-like [Mytilus edulis]|uniref:zinc finger and SCAN domain-containing protein 29-like n=1 Tax=Mytilus edulis TaxID=6550 RepID=UPI0039F043BF
MDAEQNSSKKRGLTWSDQETKALLSTWGEGKIQSELDNSTRNTHVFSSIISSMGGLGYLRTAPECRQRIKTLKRNYFNAKNSNKLSGNGRTICRYYDELEDILGGRPAVTPPKVKDSSENHSSRKNSSVECSEPEDEDGDMDIFQQPSTCSSSACSVTMVPATVKLIADVSIIKQ